LQSVTVEPEAFILQGNSDPAPNVTMLCNAFKVSSFCTSVSGISSYQSIDACSQHTSPRWRWLAAMPRVSLLVRPTSEGAHQTLVSLDHLKRSWLQYS
jgi:hypothetical protein